MYAEWGGSLSCHPYCSHGTHHCVLSSNAWLRFEDLRVLTCDVSSMSILITCKSLLHAIFSRNMSTFPFSFGPSHLVTNIVREFGKEHKVFKILVIIKLTILRVF